MKPFVYAFIGAGIGCAIASVLMACNYGASGEEVGGMESAIEEVDPLEGAYVKQGGTPVHFVFKRGEQGEPNTFFGEIDTGDEPVRGEGTIVLARDGLGTKFTMTPTGAATKTAVRDASVPADAGVAPQEGFVGTMHFLKIGKNNTILVRSDDTQATTQYKKIRSWCGSAGDDDCNPSVQATTLECGDKGLACTTKHQCACAP